MSIPYLIRKKVFRQNGEKKSLWFAVQRKLQKKGGKTEADLARVIAQRTTFHRGEVIGLLDELASVIEEMLEDGFSVTINGLGSFQTAITSNGYENPEDLTPRHVKLSRVYFVADRKLTEKVKNTKFIRIPLSTYFPASMLSKELIREEKMQMENDI